jgi:hypothetical protein
MTVLTYRGVQYFKEEENLKFSIWWNSIHKPMRFFKYRNLVYSGEKTK